VSTLFEGRAELISADAFQVYRHLDIGTAKPSKDLRARLPHHLIDIRNPDEQFSVADFVHAAVSLIPQIRARGKIPLVTGGTAYYFRSLLYGLPDTPPSNPAVRMALQNELKESGLVRLRETLREVDPVSERRIAANDSYRVMRALEVYRTSGRPLSDFTVAFEPRGDVNAVLIALARPRKELYHRINERVRRMMAEGLQSEVAHVCLMGFSGKDPGLRGIGYREFLTHVDPDGTAEPDLLGRRIEELSTAEIAAITERVATNSRRYAKRQLTFFRSFPGVHWIDPDGPEEIGRIVERVLARPR